MEFGIALPHFGRHASPEAITTLAQEAERMGLASVWVLERILRPTRSIPLYGGRTGPMPEVYARVFEPIDTLAYVAAKTERIRLGTSVIDALFHVPVVLARRFATLDQLSGGRVIAGLGQGAIEDEFAAAGVSLKRRGPGLEEFIAALRAAWGPDPVSFSGRFYRIPESQIGPKPVQPGGPPLILGASAPAAIERAARIADGYNPATSSVAALEQRIGTYRHAAQAAGRDMNELQVIVRANISAMGDARPMLTGAKEQIQGDLAGLGELGVNHVFTDFNFGQMPVNEQLERMQAILEAAM